MVRLGLRVALERSEQVVWAGEGASLREARVLATEQELDVLLLDLYLPDGRAADSVAFLKQAYPGLRIVVLTGMGTAADAREVLRRGASGYLTKDGLTDTVVDAVVSVMSGATVVAPAVRAELLESASHPSLTDRELEVLALVVEGCTNPEIGTMLGVSAGTVRTHVSRILDKLGAADRTEASTVAVRRGLV